MATSVLRSLYFLLLFQTLGVLLSSPVCAQVSEVTLDNGLRIIIAESHAVPLVAVDVWVKAGTRCEKPDQPGVAHFLEHVLFKGTPTHPDEESVDGAMEDLGGSLNAATSFDWAHFYTEVPSNAYPQAVALLADILQHATINADAVEQERPIILDEIDRNSDDPLTSLADTVRRAIYDPSTAYARPITGTPDQVKAVTRDQIYDFYTSYYVPNNTTIVVSGDVTASEVATVVSSQFNSWKKAAKLPADGDSGKSYYAVVPDGTDKVRTLLSQKDADESYFVMGFAAPSVSDRPDAWDMDVLLTILGQGGNNRLTAQLKLKLHLVDSIEGDYLTQRDPGIFTVSVALPTANVKVVQSSILNIIDDLREQPVSDSELRMAKNALKANYLFDVDTDSGHADSLGFYDSIDTYLYDVGYLDHIDAVTAADVQRTAQKYLDPTTYAVAMQVPAPSASTAKSLSLAPRRLVASAKLGVNR